MWLSVDPIPETRGSIDACLRHWAERAPAAPAIAAPGRAALSYGRLRAQTGEVLETLNALGVGRNDRVALVLPQGPEMAVAFLAITAGASCAPLNPAYRANEFEFYLTDLRATALIVQSGIDSPAREVARARGIPVIELEPLTDAEAGIFQLHAGVSTRRDPGALAQSDDVALLLHTSGTTSRPKLVPLTHANVMASAHNIRRVLHLSEADRCLNVMPLFHIHGLIGAVLSSLVSGGSVVCTSGFYAPEFFAWMDELHPTWYTAVPTVHRAILARAAANQEIIARNPLRFIRSSSAPLPTRLMAELEEGFQAPVIESYGMTEAAHQMASNPLPPLPRKAGSVGLAAGPEVSVMDAVGNLLPVGATGEVVVRGLSITRGYERNEQANQSAFTHGWFRTGDEGYLDQDRYLFITGRLKELINRGGEKIAPGEVEAALMDHPAVAEAIAFSFSHPQLGEEVAAAVVLRGDSSATERTLQEFVATRLADFKVPRRVLIVKEIPKGPTGKPQRIGLADRLGLIAVPRGERADDARPELSAAYKAPQTEAETLVAKVWQELLGLERVGVHDNFFDLGGYSLLAVRMMERIEQVSGIKLPPTTLFGGVTIEYLAKKLAEHLTESRSLLVPVQSAGSKPPLFFLLDRGIGLYCLEMARALGEDQPFYALASHGQDDGPIPETIEERAASYIQMIRTIQPEGPYLLGGYCSGGVTAFEVARQLQQRGERAALLALIAASNKNARFKSLHALVNGIGFLFRLAPATRSHLFQALRDRILRLEHFGRYYRTRLKRLPGLTPVEQIVWACRVLRNVCRHLTHFIVSSGHHDKRSNAGGRRRADDERSQAIAGGVSKAIASYIPRPYRGRVTLIWPLEEPLERRDDPTAGWGLVATEVEIHEVPGGHETSITTHVGALADRLRACVRDTCESNP